MLFRQLFDAETSTYTYLIADAETRDAVLVDPVREQLERDLTLLRELDLRLRYILDTHVHADHVTAAGRLAREHRRASVSPAGWARRAPTCTWAPGTPAVRAATRSRCSRPPATPTTASATCCPIASSPATPF